MTGTKNSRFSSTSYTRKDVSRELDPPPELTDKDLKIKMLQEDLSREEVIVGQKNSKISRLEKRIEFLESLIKDMGPKKQKSTVTELRESYGLSTRQLSMQSKLEYSGLMRKEKGEYNWTAKDKKTLSNFFGVKITDIQWEGEDG